MGDYKEKSALIAMSGGVDSAVAAYLMREAGCQCLGVNMRLFQDPACPMREGREDAVQVAAQIGIPCEVLSCTEEFQKQVIEKFIRVYEEGGTPNPCIDCNRCLKFGWLLQEAGMRGLHQVATGHYARTEYNPDTGRYLLKKALDAEKDQTYVLYMLTQRQLAHVCFPLGNMEKREVRKLAESLGFVNAEREESQDICFVPDGDYAAFMERVTGKVYPPGDFVDLQGRVVGRHRGAVRYTLGQRKGLGLAMGEPVYVCGKNMEANTVTVGPESALYSRLVRVRNLNWISIPGLSGPLRVRAKLRYRQQEQWAVARPLSNGEEILLEFDEPQRAVTAGQAAVLYDGDTVVGGGTITESGAITEKGV